ncbi:MAG: acetate uptake transporter [Thermoplasmata archaeon]
MQEAPPRVEEKAEWWATPAVIGLMGFGLTTMLAGLSNLPAPYVNGFGTGAQGNWGVFGMAMVFGGLVQLIAGIIGLRKGNLFAGSAFVGYGAFWIAFTSMLTIYAPSSLLNPLANHVGFYAIAAFAFVWMMFTLTFLINSMKHGWGIFFVFLFLFLAFILLVVKFWQLGAGDTISTGENWAVGGIIILTGLTAWYVATAVLTNWNYGRKVLPE